MTLTTAQLAERYGVSTLTIMRWVRDQGMPVEKIGGPRKGNTYLFNLSACDNFLAARPWLRGNGQCGRRKCHGCGKPTPRGNVTHDGKPWCGCDYRKAIATAGGKGAA